MIYRNNGDYQLSLEQFNKALSLGAEPDSVYGGRGRLYYYMGKYENALADLEKIALSPKRGDRDMYSTLWYLWTLGHAGVPVPARLEASLAKEVGGNWPRQAFGLFLGSRTPEQVLDSVNSMQGDERLMSLCEAYFYVGEYYLLRKDLAKASEYFRKTRDTKLTMYEEYMVAGFELARMPKE